MYDYYNFNQLALIGVFFVSFMRILYHIPTQREKVSFMLLCKYKREHYTFKSKLFQK